MNIIPTLEGGLRIEVEDATDWLLLHSIGQDAIGREQSLAAKLGERIKDEEIRADWQAFVSPDLENGFATAVHHVTGEIHRAHKAHGKGPGAVWITPQDAEHWYSTLNQARLALESEHRLGDSESFNPAGHSPATRSAFLRSQLYCAIQSLLLDHVLR